jgi:hypothetical protein
MKNRIPGEFRAGDDFGQEIGMADFGRAFFLDQPKNLARHSTHESISIILPNPIQTMSSTFPNMAMIDARHI